MSNDADVTVGAILELAELAGEGSAVDAPAIWKHSGGIFGGFTTSLALATAAKQVELDTIASAQVMFARATEPGPLQVTVEVVRRGGSSAAVHIRVRQGEFDRVLVQASLVDGPVEVGERVTVDVAAPMDCGEVTCWDSSLPYMRAIDERAIDYPLTIEGFPGGPSHADLWVRDAQGSWGDPLAGQLLDVITLDTHLVDAACRPLPSLAQGVVSMDLTVIWSSTAPTEWRRVRAEASGPGHRLAPTVGTIWAEDGTVRARASQLARFSSRPAP